MILQKVYVLIEMPRLVFNNHYSTLQPAISRWIGRASASKVEGRRLQGCGYVIPDFKNGSFCYPCMAFSIMGKEIRVFQVKLKMPCSSALHIKKRARFICFEFYFSLFTMILISDNGKYGKAITDSVISETELQIPSPDARSRKAISKSFNQL